MSLNYATLYQVRAYLKLGANETGDDTLLSQLISKATDWINDTRCLRRFDIRRETRRLNNPYPPTSGFGRYPIPSGMSRAAWMVQGLSDFNTASAGLLKVDDDLLEVLDVVNGDGSAILPSDYVLEPNNRYPKYGLRLTNQSGKAWRLSGGGDWRQVIPVDGLWGYHEHYPEAFVDSLDTVQDDPLVIGATVLTVQDSDGLPEDIQEPRFQAGLMLKLSDNAGNFEFVRVVSVNDTTDKLTIKRAFNGSDPREWPKGTAISIFRPWGNVNMATLRLVAWRYRQKDANVFDKTTILGTGISIIPSAVPPDIDRLLPPARKSFSDV